MAPSHYARTPIPFTTDSDPDSDSDSGSASGDEFSPRSTFTSAKELRCTQDEDEMEPSPSSSGSGEKRKYDSKDLENEADVKKYGFKPHKKLRRNLTNDEDEKEIGSEDERELESEDELEAGSEDEQEIGPEDKIRPNERSRQRLMEVKMLLLEIYTLMKVSYHEPRHVKLQLMNQIKTKTLGDLSKMSKTTEKTHKKHHLERSCLLLSPPSIRRS